MTINKSETITIKKWVVLLVLPFAVSAVVGYSASQFAKGRQENQIIVNTKRIDNLESNKVERNELELVLDGIDRIEKKLDTHIDKDN
jgi:hypothetical protein